MSTPNGDGGVPALMNSAAFRYAILAVLCVVLVVGALICYRTRITQRRLALLHANLPVRGRDNKRDWGPPPVLFDAYIEDPPPPWPSPPRRLVEWDSMMPISVGRDELDPSGVSARAHVSTMICMPFAAEERPAPSSEPIPDDDRYLPHLEIGYIDVQAPLNMKALTLRPSSEAGSEPTSSDTTPPT
ncbi:Polyketide beta-ketoacyl-synthase [Mycena chlorophos]|uniref:Polyketide beta-ketoacyl-synthase n=1 Tax=Mycena chlorophos TaxID=658473 RepID=A0A8H6TLA6_MYCCL|nr:Polyketide beta-ketoacyl-synthase [Mycena chlorophos]